MKRIIFYIAVVAVLAGAASCKKDFMNLQPLDKFSSEAVWKDPALIQTFVNNIYLGVPHGFSNIMMSSLVDETMYNADFGTSNVTKSLLTPSDIGIFDEGFWTANRQRLMQWSMVYKFVRAANQFFENVDQATFDKPELKDRMKGEVYFLRAYLYHDLVSMYGGVPIIKRTFGLNDDFNVPRDSYEDCINFIVSDLDSAAMLLPESYSGNDKGRATKVAALALKSRVLLYAASDLYNSNGSWANGYAHPELIGYTSGSQQDRWVKARDAAKAALDAADAAGAGLYMPNPASAEEATKNYSDIFISKDNPEDIFLRYFTVKIDENWDGYNPGLYNNPNGWHGWGSNTPIGQMVDAYEMSDGSKFSWNNPAEAAKPYENRDPRFYASINYDGALWRPRPTDAVGRDPIGIVQSGYYTKPDGTIIPGLDTRNSPLEDWNGSYTGYYMRKFIDPSINAQYDKQDQPWRYIRYSELVLNYAETLIETGDEATARMWLNKIRKRAFMPDITSSGQTLTDEYRNERRIELAFEDQRYFDVRRWMIAPMAYQNAEGVRIDYKVDATASTSDYTTKVIGEPKFTVINAQDREWNPRFYLFPIKLDEMNRNSALIQNPLY